MYFHGIYFSVESTKYSNAIYIQLSYLYYFVLP